MSVGGFIESAYAAYKSFMEAFVKVDEHWKIMRDENVAVVLIGQKGMMMMMILPPATVARLLKAAGAGAAAGMMKIKITAGSYRRFYKGACFPYH